MSLNFFESVLNAVAASGRDGTCLFFKKSVSERNA